MKENNLLASVALFSELYNNENYTNVTDILGEFIKGVVVTENKWTVNSTELKHLLEIIYDFNIPESVVRTTVKNRLKEIVTLKDGHYVFDSKIKEDFIKINLAYNTIQEKQNRIVSQLAAFVESKEGTSISDQEKKVLIENLNKYLLDNGVNDKYSKYISAFIISNQQIPDFTDNLNLIKEGLILYQGIRYTSDINELGKWNSELTIYLSTEHLFNSLGFNGILFEQIFTDFYSLVNEINSSAKIKNGEKLIQLKYLEETKDEIDAFFQTAEYILKGSATLDTTKPAMKSILDGCRTPSDIKTKKIKFISDLVKKGILLREFKTSIYQYNDYVVEDEKILEELKKFSEGRGKIFDENLCRQFFKIFTKINYLRGGESKTKFENIGSIFITGNRFALFLSHNSKVKFQEFDIPFAKDIDYITSKFWFKLKKGFNNKASLPKAFDIVTKAQIIISSQLNQTVFQEYHRLQNQIKVGSLTIDQAKQLSYELRQKPNKPEEITIETIDSSLDFLTNDSYFEDLHREKEKKDILLKDTLKANEELQDEIKRRDEIERQKEQRIKGKKREVEKVKYLKLNWNNYKGIQIQNLVYFLMVLILTLLPIFLGFILKINSDLNNWLTSIGERQYFIWVCLALIFLVELFGRSYLFNKEKVKSGWTWLTVILQSSKLTNLKKEKILEFDKEFSNQYREE
ncbi:MAG TPA: hypothetical protein VL443_17580 [Cyclobacteriaceae bacterium]|jgi:hypothetical protein|nr:hypothetical protein [Cyclobacteriaceae bacterium]